MINKSKISNKLAALYNQISSYSPLLIIPAAVAVIGASTYNKIKYSKGPTLPDDAWVIVEKNPRLFEGWKATDVSQKTMRKWSRGNIEQLEIAWYPSRRRADQELRRKVREAFDTESPLLRQGSRYTSHRLTPQTTIAEDLTLPQILRDYLIEKFHPRLAGSDLLL